LVHDLSAELGKEISLVTEGGETELDKTVIEKLNDPLIHQCMPGDLAGYTDATYVNFLQQNDISVRRSGGNLVANSLADLR
jgi:hypothetical protein